MPGNIKKTLYDKWGWGKEEEGEEVKKEEEQEDGGGHNLWSSL